MELFFDPDVRAVAEFMQRNIPCCRLTTVAEGVGAIAPILWGHFQSEPITTLKLVEPPPISDDDRRTQSVATE